MNPAVLRSIFQSFGSIESIRILSHKNCGFVNFERQEDAVRARKQMQNKEILGPGTGTVRVGFAKAPTNNPGEVIEDVVISGNTVTSYATPATTAAAAAKAAAAKAAANKTASTSINPSPSSSSASINEQTTSNDTTQWATVILMASMMMNAQKQQQQSNGATTPGLSNTTSSSSSSANLVANNYARLASERMMIMQQLGYEVKSDEGNKPNKYMDYILIHLS
jgi:RNA recognition motif-containing protein